MLSNQLTLGNPVILIAVVSLALALLVMALYWRLRQKTQGMAAALAKVSRELDGVQSRDPLTGLMTRSRFESALDEAVRHCEKDGTSLCVLYLDLDHFRSINEAFGRAIGDAVLAEVGQRIGRRMGGANSAAHLNGNEFAMVLRGHVGTAKQAAAALIGDLARPITLAVGEIRLTCSIGIAVYPAQASRKNVLERATVAMRTVKLQGGDGYAGYDQLAADGRREAARLLHELRRAVEQGELELYYQPKIDADSLQITAVEALVRWCHPQAGIVSPDKFIPLAEKYGVILPIGRWVIEEACRQAQVWRAQGLRMRIAVNISGHQMRQDDFVEHLEGVLTRTHIPASRFTCEITESVAMEDTAATMQTFDRLRRLGVHVSIDDFGTGHSSLASLNKIPAAELKIDRAFVTDLETSEHAQFIANTIVNMAHTLNMRVVAEGVETREQRDLLVKMGCDELQGYLFAKPMRAEELGSWSTRDHDDDEAAFRPSLYGETLYTRLE